MEAKRRFGGREFQSRVKNAGNYKRLLAPAFNFSSRFWKRVGLGAFLVLFYYFVVSSYFVVSHIEVSGNNKISSDSIAGAIRAGTDSRVFLVKRSNFFLMTEGRVNKVLTDAIPNIKMITKYDRTWPNKISLEVKEREPGFVILSEGNYFLVDEDGTIVGQVDAPGDLLVAEDQVSENFARGEVLQNPKLAAFIVSMSRQWGSKINTNVTGVKFAGKSSNDVQFSTGEGWSVMFDSNRSASVQLTNLAVLLSTQIGGNRPRLAYIDLRLSKAYYCFKLSPCEATAPQEQKDQNAQE